MHTRKITHLIPAGLGLHSNSAHHDKRYYLTSNWNNSRTNVIDSNYSCAKLCCTSSWLVVRIQTSRLAKWYQNDHIRVLDDQRVPTEDHKLKQDWKRDPSEVENHCELETFTCNQVWCRQQCLHQIKRSSLAWSRIPIQSSWRSHNRYESQMFVKSPLLTSRQISSISQFFAKKYGIK